MTLSVVSPGGAPPSPVVDTALPLGATTEEPAQRSSRAGGTTETPLTEMSGRDDRALQARDQPRPENAVADHETSPPPVSHPEHRQAEVVPQARRDDAPTIDPAAVELPGERTRDTQTFANPDGSRTLRAHSAQANVQRSDGSWQPVDLALRHDGDRLRPTTSPVELDLAPTSGDPVLVRIAFGDGKELSYRAEGVADVTGEPQGDRVTYRDVRPGVDLVLQATRTGVKEDLVLTDAIHTSFSFTLAPLGLEPRLVDGAVHLLDGDRLVATMPQGRADDAKGVRSTAVRYSLDAAGGNTWMLRVDLDEQWLRSPDRAFPVIVDPSAALFNADRDDTYVRSNQSGRSGAVELETGRVQGQPLARSYLHFGNALELRLLGLQ